MKYYKLRKVVTVYTTLSLVTSEEDKSFFYSEKDGLQYFGVETTDADFLAKQYVECEVEELSFSDVESILLECHLNKQLNLIIVNRIRAKYSIDDEIALLKKDDTDANKIAYNLFVSEVKAEVNLQKINYGLKQ